MGSVSLSRSEEISSTTSQTKIIVAAEDIEAGAKTLPFPLTSALCRIDPRFEFRSPNSNQLEVGLGLNGEIRLLSPLLPQQQQQSSANSSFWPKLIALAPDCHSQNVRLCIWQGPNKQNKLILLATKHIYAGQRLSLWFSDELLVDVLKIPPFLSPSCIRGRGNTPIYTCSDCHSEFQFPNNLKIHMALQCGSLSRDIFWGRLAHLKSPSQHQLNGGSHTEGILIHQNQPGVRSLLSHSSTPSFHISSSIQYISPLSSTSSLRISPVTPRARTAPPPPSSSLTLNESLLRIAPTSTPQHSLNTNTLLHPPSGSTPGLGEDNKMIADPQAHLETLVSNMGKAKNGHICLYCGKLYSRKYGLKIHIRTHTKYKPLQCRICHRPFGDPSNLNKHVRLHSDGSTPYRCGFCEKVLVRKRDLDRHIRSRHSHTTSSIPIHSALGSLSGI